jgi:hypothetical protein
VGHILYNGFKGGERMRESKNFEELEKPIPLTVKTKCPEKYLLIDRESGDMFIGDPRGHWNRLETIARDS